MTATVLLTFLWATAWSEPITLQQLFADQKSQDGKILTVTGTVKGYYEKADFSACLLFDSGKACSLYMPPHQGLRNEQRVTVTGPFSLSKQIGGRHFSNVIETTDVQSAP